ncbi:MAG TPA: response regulator transcription factor [Verrucomicrobiae bacterium]|nr:response regulator transcription factor [Verrucomicrobiae bacterium]
MRYKENVSISVAIVEDDNEARKILAAWLSQAPGFNLVADWGQAEAAFPSLLQKKPDVVLMDINLPGISGVEAVRRLKRELPATQFVMLTVYEDADHIYDALASGATGYLLKETPREDLLKAIQDVHHGGSPMTSNIARKVVQSFGQARAVSSSAEELSHREKEVLELLAQGYLYKEIAEKMNVSIPTVNTYVRRVYEKLHVRSRGQAVAKYAHLSPSSRPP